MTKDRKRATPVESRSVDEILLTFERNAVGAWKYNRSGAAIVRKLRPNRAEAKAELISYIEGIIGVDEDYVTFTKGKHGWLDINRAHTENIEVDGRNKLRKEILAKLKGDGTVARKGEV